MIFVIGGSYQGKNEFVEKKYGISSSMFSDETFQKVEELYESHVITHFELVLKQLQDQNIDSKRFLEILRKENPQVVIIGTEVGMGILPLEKTDRDFREYVGRNYCIMAREAEEVWRVICGIGEQLK